MDTNEVGKVIDTEEVNELLNEVPDGVDLSDPFDVLPTSVMPVVIDSEEVLIIVLARRLMDLPKDDSFYDEFVDDLASQATEKWYRKGDIDMVSLYVKKNMGKILAKFPDLAETRVSLAKERMKRARSKRKRSKK